MSRLRLRLSILATIRLAVGVMLLCVVWSLVRGKGDVTGAGAFLAFLVNIVSQYLFDEAQIIADEARDVRDDRRDARIQALEDMTPPRGTPVFYPKGDVP